MQQALDHIEQQLNGELTLEGCAAAANYSPYHFSRIFHSMTGLPPMDYVRKRRLTCAAGEIACSQAPILDIALRWGFDSAETFHRAFVAEHGVTPGKYRLSRISLHLTEPFRLPLSDTAVFPEPEIVYYVGGTVCGYGLHLPPGAPHGVIPQFWNRYHVEGLARTLPGCPADGWFDDVGCSLPDAPDGSRRYLCGIWSDRNGPPGSELLHIPAGLYAVFATPPADALTFVETIHRTWDHSRDIWLPNSGYHWDHRPSFETYCEKSRTFIERIYLPITKKEADHEEPTGKLPPAAL